MDLPPTYACQVCALPTTRMLPARVSLTIITDAASCNAIYAGIYAAMIVSNGGGVFALGGWADVMIFSRATLPFTGVVCA